MIYFLRSEQDSDEIEAGWIKIGTSVRLSVRLQQIAARIGHTPTVLGVIDGGYAEEAALHARYKGFRRVGEWFDPEGSDVMQLIRTEARPWDGSDENPLGRLVRFEDKLIEKARKVAALRGMKLADFITEILRPAVDQHLREEIAKLAESEGITVGDRD